MENLGDISFDQEITVTQEVLDTVHYTASKADLYAGQVISVRELFSAILMPSGADAIAVFAHYIFNGLDDLALAMNDKAKEVGMINTSIINPFGLDEAGQYTTLDDLLTLLKYNLNNEEFKQLYGTKQYTLSNDNDIVFENENLLFAEAAGFTFMRGAKSGYTYEAEQSLSSYASNDEETYIFISTQAGLKLGENFKPAQDAIKVYTYLFDNYSQVDLVGDNQVVCQLELKGRIRPLSIKSDAMSAIVSNQFDDQLFSIEAVYDENLSAPLTKGEVIGTLNYMYDGVIVHSTPIEISQKINKSLVFRLIPFIILILIIIGIRLIVKHRRKSNYND